MSCTNDVTLMRSSLERESPDDEAGDVADVIRHKARITDFGGCGSVARRY